MIYVLILGTLFIIGSYIPWGKLPTWNGASTRPTRAKDLNKLASCKANMYGTGEPECIPRTLNDIVEELKMWRRIMRSQNMNTNAGKKRYDHAKGNVIRLDKIVKDISKHLGTVK